MCVNHVAIFYITLRVCFDNFNHIDASVLSVVAHYIQTIQEATKSAQQNFIINGITLPMNLSCAIFTTLSSLDPMNCHEKLQYAYFKILCIY